MAESDIIISIKDGIQTIKFNRPLKRNALHHQMYVDLTAALYSAAEDDDVKLTVLTGEGNYYSSGNDLTSAMRGASNLHESVLTVRNCVDAFISYPKLLVAVVNGPAIGIATTTLGLCDLVYASDKATFSTPFTKLGICVEGCSSYTFPRILGPRKATEVLLLSKEMSAEEAFRYGFVNKVIPHSKLQQEVSACLAEYSQLSHQSVIVCKQLMKRFDQKELYLANIEEVKCLIERWKSPDSAEALMKFLSRKSKM